jgi:competence transcription factor ComK
MLPQPTGGSYRAFFYRLRRHCRFFRVLLGQKEAAKLFCPSSSVPPLTVNIINFVYSFTREVASKKTDEVIERA